MTMQIETLTRLQRIARGEIVPPCGVTGVTGVTGVAATPVKRQNPPSLHPLHPLHVLRAKTDKAETTDFAGAIQGVTDIPFDVCELAERTAIALELGRVPVAYAEAWARLQVQKPSHLKEPVWRRALHDAGRFLDEWGALAFEFGWWPNDIFGASGLAFICAGERVRALGPNHAVSVSGRTFIRRNSGPS
jgi:hypothetical protein